MDQSLQPSLITDIINVIVDLAPVSFMNVSKALNARAYAALEASTSDRRTDNAWWTAFRYEVFAKCVPDAIFKRLLPKFVLNMYSIPVLPATDHLYKNCLYSKLVIFADYYRNLSKSGIWRWSILGLTPAHVATYLREYGVSDLDIMWVSGKPLISLTKWSSYIKVKQFIHGLSLAHIRELYATRQDIVTLEGMHDPEHLLTLEPEALALIIKLSRRCHIRVLLAALSKRLVGVVAEIANPEVVLQRDRDDIIAMRSECAYIFTYAAESFAEPSALAAIRDRVRVLATAPQFTQITFAFDQYRAADPSMPEIVQHRREILLTVAHMGANNPLFTALFAWCCETDDRALVGQMVESGAACDPQLATYYTSKTYEFMTQCMMESSHPYHHFKVADMVLLYLQHQTTTKEMALKIMEYAERKRDCPCRAANILQDALIVSITSTDNDPDVYAGLRQRLKDRMAGRLFAGVVMQSILDLMGGDDPEETHE